MIDLAGPTLLPGLIDLHVHLGAPEREAVQDVILVLRDGRVVVDDRG